MSQSLSWIRGEPPTSLAQLAAGAAQPYQLELQEVGLDHRLNLISAHGEELCQRLQAATPTLEGTEIPEVHRPESVLVDLPGLTRHPPQALEVEGKHRGVEAVMGEQLLGTHQGLPGIVSAHVGEAYEEVRLDGMGLEHRAQDLGHLVGAVRHEIDHAKASEKGRGKQALVRGRAQEGRMPEVPDGLAPDGTAFLGLEHVEKQVGALAHEVDLVEKDHDRGVGAPWQPRVGPRFPGRLAGRRESAVDELEQTVGVFDPAPRDIDQRDSECPCHSTRELRLAQAARTAQHHVHRHARWRCPKRERAFDLEPSDGRDVADVSGERRLDLGREPGGWRFGCGGRGCRFFRPLRDLDGRIWRRLRLQPKELQAGGLETRTFHRIH